MKENIGGVYLSIGFIDMTCKIVILGKYVF